MKDALTVFSIHTHTHIVYHLLSSRQYHKETEPISVGTRQVHLRSHQLGLVKSILFVFKFHFNILEFLAYADKLMKQFTVNKINSELLGSIYWSDGFCVAASTCLNCLWRSRSVCEVTRKCSDPTGNDLPK